MDTGRSALPEADFDPKVIKAAAETREVRLTTFGRVTGKPVGVTIWVTTDGRRLFVRSGQGLRRDWPRNLLQRNEATLRLGRVEVEVRASHITDPAEGRRVSELVRDKYGFGVKPSRPDEPLTPGEQASFELRPAYPSSDAT